jgi:TRAP-type C4-dicarboxylate transport system permease small subunit
VLPATRIPPERCLKSPPPAAQTSLQGMADRIMAEAQSKPDLVVRRGRMDRFIDGIELLAAFFVGIVAADIFTSVLLRYFFSVQIPDSYDFGRLLLGILIFWGIAATSYRGTHITVDLVYANVGPKLQRFIDVFATLVLLFVVSVQTWTLFDKVVSTRADNVLTFDLRLPTWPFFLVAWLGDVSAVLLIAVRTYRLIFHPELMGGQYQIKPVE